MCSNQISKGHCLLVVLIITVLLALSLTTISGAVVLEYQQTQQQMAEHVLWQTLTATAQAWLATNESRQMPPPDVIITNNKMFVPDDLNINCATGLVITQAIIPAQHVPAQLIITYSVRQ